MGLDSTPTRLLMPQVNPADTTEWTHTQRRSTLFVRYVRLQNRADTSAGADVWRVAALTPAALVVERTILDEGAPHPFRYRWYYHRRAGE